ncbi:MAG: hypothetical protein J5748_04560 [Bacteroidales bacterium]|nr:hypothetical protein [Bacteroidales bacterium]
MKTNHALLIVAACLCLAGCKQSTEYPPVKSISLEYPSLSAYEESWNCNYDSEGRLKLVEKKEVADKEKHLMSWSYAYDAEELKAVSEAKGWRKSRTASVAFQDDFTHMLSYTLPEDTEEDEYGIVFLGQNWVATYDAGRLTKAVFTDFTSDGMDISMFTWGEDGLLVKYEGSDPGVFIEIKDIEYLETPNPFKGPDPVALIMGMNSFYWQGFAGPRPASLVAGYTRVTSDPWVEDVSIDHISITYETDLDGRISHIVQTANGVLENVAVITY